MSVIWCGRYDTQSHRRSANAPCAPANPPALTRDKDRMLRMSAAEVFALYRYPVKGFSPEPLTSADIAIGGTMPFDRAYAVENGPSGFDPAAPSYLPKAYFLMLMKNERMAEFQTRFDDRTKVLGILRDGALQVEGSLATADGRAVIEAWLAENFRNELRGAPRILSAPGFSFSDVPEKVLHLVNLASVRALEEKLGRPVDPLRFRPNMLIDGLAPFGEFDWIGKGVRLPGLTLAGRQRTSRCAATNVDPKTGARDMQIPRFLDGQYGNEDFGIYLAADSAGRVAVGDPIELAD
jgi:uncharacterized protein YcbX